MSTADRTRTDHTEATERSNNTNGDKRGNELDACNGHQEADSLDFVRTVHKLNRTLHESTRGGSSREYFLTEMESARLKSSKLSNGSKRGDYGNVSCKFSHGLNYSKLAEQLNRTIAETRRGDLKTISLGLLGSGTALAIVDTWKNENYIGIEFKFPLDAWHQNSNMKDEMDSNIDMNIGLGEKNEEYEDGGKGSETVRAPTTAVNVLFESNSILLWRNKKHLYVEEGKEATEKQKEVEFEFGSMYTQCKYLNMNLVVFVLSFFNTFFIFFDVSFFLD